MRKIELCFSRASHLAHPPRNTTIVVMEAVVMEAVVGPEVVATEEKKEQAVSTIFSTELEVSR
jgi:hypothetical protein